ncbi:hypothetical protein AA313_de0200967 [Arthrobotrys entomopaga]|nr:hypothetical protein AA313_de0200967 [Arthrobotrys entomopaga]
MSEVLATDQIPAQCLTGAGNFRLLSLPWELRLQIYQDLITYAVNIIYSSPVQLEEGRQHAGIPRRSGSKTKKPLYQFIRRDEPGGITYKLSSFPTFKDTTINAPPALLLVSKAFSSDIRTAASIIKRRIRGILDKHITGSASYNKSYPPFDTPPASFESEFLNLIGSARHIFGGYGHNTTIAANRIPTAVAERITSVFLGYLNFECNAPNAWSEVDFPFVCEYAPYGYPSNRAFEVFIARFPNLETLAMPVGPYSTQKNMTDMRREWIIRGVFLSLCDMRDSFKSLELVFKDRNYNTYVFDDVSLNYYGTGRRMWWSDAHVEFLRDTEGPVKLSEEELNGRGRYWSVYDPWKDRYTATLMEGAVWRITKGKNHEHSSVARRKHNERQLERARKLGDELNMQRVVRFQRDEEVRRINKASRRAFLHNMLT